MTLPQYLALPYAVTLKRDESGDVVARIQELPGCVARGSNEAEALKNLREIQRMWIESGIRSETSIPLPGDDSVLSVPRSLHLKLVRHARREKTSLNQAVTAILTEAVGAKGA